jgi:hypothetical protein
MEILGDSDKKLEVIRAAARHDYPTADIDIMLAEIELGCVGILGYKVTGFSGMAI